MSWWTVARRGGVTGLLEEDMANVGAVAITSECVEGIGCGASQWADLVSRKGSDWEIWVALKESLAGMV